MPSATKIFTELTGRLDYPMLVVTAAASDELAGCLVGFSTQCSIDPARFLVCISDKNRTFELAQRSDALAVHFLGADAADLARLFGGQTGDELDKFSRCRWHAGPHGLPIIDRCDRWFAGRILDRRELGDHWGYLLEPFAAQDAGGGDNLAFSQVKQLTPGHEA
ncbi:MAG TPA: flavin reductase family protein [Solirubrobacteraceae bacterium]|jgi:flavin reductase (DIM6/NTAB) family NADH-FMN oxidoreductase RutF